MLELPIAEVAPALGASPTTAQIGPTRNDGLPASPPCGGGCPTGPQRETLLGALGMVFGPVVGALMVVELENYLARLGAWVALV